MTRIKVGFEPGGSGQFPAGDPPARRFTECLRQVKLARKWRFDSIWAGQHYLSYPFYTLQSIPFLARLSAESGDMTVGTSILLLPLLHPVDVAEKVATLDAITAGKCVLGVGLGYRNIEYEAFGIPREQRVSRLEESIKLIKMLWTQDSVSYQGKHFTLSRVRPTLKPVQKPHPPIWIAGNKDPGIIRAARMGSAWLAPPHSSFSTLKRQVSIYKRALQRLRKPAPIELPICKELYVAKNRDQAISEAKPYLMAKYGTYIEWGQDKEVPVKDKFDISFQEFLDTYRFVVGDVDFCTDVISKHYEKLGFNHFIFRMQWSGMEQSKVLKSMQLLGDKILPYLRTAF